MELGQTVNIDRDPVQRAGSTSVVLHSGPAVRPGTPCANPTQQNLQFWFSWANGYNWYFILAGKHANPSAPRAMVSPWDDNPRRFSSGRSHNCWGTSPVNWLPDRFKACKRVRPPNSPGISPVNWFPERSSRRRLDNVPNSLGISPVNWFPERAKSLSWDRLYNSRGILPARFPCMDRFTR